MNFGGISLWQLLIVLVIVILLFGTKKLRSLGGDLGGAIKNFKQSMQEGAQTINSKNDKTIKHGDVTEEKKDETARGKHTS